MKEVLKALSGFQKEVPVIHKGTKGYGYSYADLPTIFPIINPLLDKYGLGFYQAFCGNTIKTVLFHAESGESIESEINIPQGVQLKGMNEFQVLGSGITYIRRYALSALLGLVTDKDNDGNGEVIETKAKEPIAAKTEVPNTGTTRPDVILESSKTLKELGDNYKALSAEDQVKYKALATAIKSKLSKPN